ncbi:hypothetical protein DVS28_a1939 [Euzebya pacifica]|mgnify:CR=1 FL=1|uniref:Uncharacterized protein n=1 Tax=Euzebya pacifica TaxID=1608957 RepID=A0A346XWM7_9ACTN|nr:hypothetical protein DVS28_a1939 [Euzebya pacifica]
MVQELCGLIVPVSESGVEATYPSPLCNDDLWVLSDEPGF